MAYPCDNKENFDMGACLQCSGKGCNRMGYWASKTKETGKLFLNTKSPLKAPYCMQNYAVTLFSDELDGLSNNII